MKAKGIVFCALLAALCALAMNRQAGQDTTLQPAQASFVLPSELIEIEEEAFSGTRAEQVILPSSLQTIGERAFADMTALREVSIPASVSQIGEDAFSGASGLTIYGVSDSYAQRWAVSNGYSFVHRDIWTAPARAQIVWTMYLVFLYFLFRSNALEALLRCLRRAAGRLGALRSMRRNDRAELHAQDGYFP